MSLSPIGHFHESCEIHIWSDGPSVLNEEIKKMVYDFFIIPCTEMVQVANEILSYGRQGHMYLTHYNDVIMSTIASQITSLTIVYSTVYSGTDQRKFQSSASLAFVRGINRWPRKMFPFDDVIMLVETMATDDQLTHGARGINSHVID